MAKQIAFISELPFTGKVARNHPHMRTEFAQFCALKADHYCFYDYDTTERRVKELLEEEIEYKTIFK